MKYEVEYTNPNNAIRTEPYLYETRSKKDLNEFLRDARKYPGSYSINEVRKVSESKTNPKITYLPF